MNQEKNQRRLAAAIPLLLIASVLAAGPAEADHGGGVVTAEDVAAGESHTCVLTSGGDVDCYGSNTYGQAADYHGGDAVGVAAGDRHTCVLLSGGDVDCYGFNNNGQATDYHGGDAVGVAAGVYHTCVLTSGGDVDCYGNNGFGQATDYHGGDAVGVATRGLHTCLLLSGGNVDCYGGGSQSADYLGGDAVGVAAGGSHTCVLTSGGDVDCYGFNNNGQATDYHGGDAVGVAAGESHTCVLTSGGDVDCYGSNTYGQAADYHGGDAVGVAAGNLYTCVLLSGGDVDCYGYNVLGQSADWFGDSDGDGWHNDDEALCGSDPMDDDSVPPFGCIGAGSTGGTASKQFLHEDNVTVVPSQGVPPDDVNGTPTPDHPGTDPEPTPDHNGTDPVPTPDHNGTDPVPTPEAGERVATVTVRDEGELVCVDVTPEGGSAIPVACLDRDRLGPADGHVPRGDTAVVYLSEEETPDVPGTPSQEVPDVPGTDPQPVPDVPGTPSQDVPDVPPVPGGSLGTTPHVTVSLDASYRYDPDRLNQEGSVLGQDVWSPAGPGDEAWFLASGDDVGMTVTVSVHEDGEHVATVPVSVPYLGQALAAAEATAGTL